MQALSISPAAAVPTHLHWGAGVQEAQTQKDVEAEEDGRLASITISVHASQHPQPASVTRVASQSIGRRIGPRLLIAVELSSS